MKNTVLNSRHESSLLLRLEFRSAPRYSNGPHALLVGPRVLRALRDAGLRRRGHDCGCGRNDRLALSEIMAVSFSRAEGSGVVL